VAGSLEGLLVVELGGFIAGPFAGQLLGDYGARVIKVEPPTGDPLRSWGRQHDGVGLWWPSLGRNKESVVVDLRADAGRQAALRLCTAADVVVENFAPGRLAEWGLDWPTLSAANPRLVLTHVSGYGQDGPRAQDRGFGSVAEAMGGIRGLLGYPDRPPSRAGISLGDALAALFAVIGTLAALRDRDRSGLGQEVDVALYEAVFALMESTLADHEIAGFTRSRTGSTLPGIAPSNAYPTADGKELIVAANADPLFRRLVAAMGAPELADDPRFTDHRARGERMAELDDLVSAWTSARTTEELEATLDDAGVPRGRIFDAADMLADPQYAAREMIVRVPVDGLQQELPMPGIVPKLSRTPGAVRHPGPALGEHTAAVAAEFGLAL
jgi:crotonobetainyl-CoA:carnitine CoA-transferase CaiB-like acyl-CoA transferase